jgi:hypothetical protein
MTADALAALRAGREAVLDIGARLTDEEISWA